MIDLTAYNKYLKFLKSLPFTRKKEYFIDDDEFQCLIDIDVLKELGFTYINPIERYKDYPKNNHHWQTSFVWKNIIPMIAKDLEIPFDEKDFILCPLRCEGHDISFHNPVADPILRMGQYRDSIVTGAYSNLVRCFKSDGAQVRDCWSSYHGLFTYFHTCCIIHNTAPKTDRVLLMNVDSMSIPIVPILIPYFKTIYVLDNRTRSPWFEDNVDKSEITDYISLGLTRSYVHSDTFIYRETSNNKIFQQNIQ